MTYVTHRDIAHKLKPKIVPNLSSMFLDNTQLTYYGLLRCLNRSQIMRCKLCLTDSIYIVVDIVLYSYALPINHSFTLT